MTFHLFGGKRDERMVLTFSTALLTALDAYRVHKSKASVVRLAIARLIRDDAELQPEHTTLLADTRCDLRRFELLAA